MSDIKLPPLPEPTAFLFCKGSEVTARAWGVDEMCAYARAAVEAARVPDVSKELLRLADIMRDCGRLVSKSGSAESILRTAASLLSSAPPVAQPAESPNRPSREWYEKKIHETMDDDFSIGPAQPEQAQPAERKPLTEDPITEAIKAGVGSGA